MQWCSLGCTCPPSTEKEPSTALAGFAKGIWLLNLDYSFPVKGTGCACMCYVNSVELTNAVDAEVEDGDVIWCLRASPDMGHEVEILSIASPSDASEAEGVGPTMPAMAAPPALMGSVYHCRRS